jgi:hypothetical protein
MRANTLAQANASIATQHPRRRPETNSTSTNETGCPQSMPAAAHTCEMRPPDSCAIACVESGVRPKWAEWMTGAAAPAVAAACAKAPSRASCSTSSLWLTSRATRTAAPATGHQHSPTRAHPRQTPTCTNVPHNRPGRPSQLKGRDSTHAQTRAPMRNLHARGGAPAPAW